MNLSDPEERRQLLESSRVEPAIHQLSEEAGQVQYC